MPLEKEKLGSEGQKITEYQIITTAVNVGKILLESGAETYKVEESIEKICKYYGVKTKPFVIPTCIMCSAKNSKGEIFSLIERIKDRATDLDKVHEVNALIQNIKEHKYPQFVKEVGKIARKKGYSNIKKMVAYTGGAAFFSILFKGGISEFIVSGLCGLILFFWIKLADYIRINQYFKLAVGGGICSLVSFILSEIIPNTNVTIGTISSLMLMVPGISFTNGIRDLISGDFVSGISRGVEAIIIAASLAAGSSITLYILMRLGEV